MSSLSVWYVRNAVVEDVMLTCRAYNAFYETCADHPMEVHSTCSIKKDESIKASAMLKVSLGTAGVLLYLKCTSVLASAAMWW